ncbi:MAG: S26 family signal peptidase, partial [Bacteroidota bacterium]
GTETKSYLDWVTFGYARLGSGDVERNDPFVFNYPTHDVDNIRNPEYGTVDIPSMKENYIKRAVAIPGDEFEIRAGEVYINGKKGVKPPDMLVQYHVVTKNERLGASFMSSLDYNPNPKAMDNPNSNWQYLRSEPGTGADSASYFHHYYVSMTEDLIPKFEALGAVVSVERLLYPKGVHMFEPDPTGQLEQMLAEDTAMLKRAQSASQTGNVPKWSRLGKYAMFPHAKQYPWNLDWFGPITIPKAGATVELTTENLPLYERIIAVYEGHDLQVQGEKILIDGQPATSYTFELDYYFAMGDNRYNSEDSRYWGFVPESHVIGKPMFVGLNWQKGNRFFKGID